MGINVHDPKFGAWWGASDHLKNARNYNVQWEKNIFGNNSHSPSHFEILDYGRKIMKEFGISTGY